MRKIWQLHYVFFIGSKSKLLVNNKKDADMHFEINETDVSTCGKIIHLENVLGTTNQYEMVFDGIKKFNRSVNRLMSEFGLLQSVAKTNSFINIVVYCTDLNYGDFGVTVLRRCAYSGVILCTKIWKLQYGSHIDLAQLIAFR